MSTPEIQIGPKIIDASSSQVASKAASAAQCWIAVAAIALVALTFLLFWPTTSSLIVRWEDTVHRTYTHGYLIVALSLWLIWRERTHFNQAHVSAFGAAILIVTGLLWLIALRAGLQIVHQALIPVLASAAVLTCCGWAVTKKLWMPLGFLYYAVPVWDAINPLLQWTSVFAVRVLLRVAGIPAFFADNTFQIPAGAFEIADGCSGLHFFVVGTAIAVLYGAINRDTMQIRIKLFLLAAMLAMATNWLRIFIIVLAGHLTDMDHYLVSAEHYSFGWVMFACAMLLFFLIVRRWPVTDGQPDAQILRTAHNAPIAGTMLAVACLSIAPLWVLLDNNTAVAADLHRLPPVEAKKAFTQTFSPWQPRFTGSDVEQRRQYAAMTEIDAYTAIYLEQKQGKELIGYENSLFGETMRAVGPINLVDARWNEVRARDASGEDWLVRFAYRIDERWYTSPLRSQLAYGVRSLSSAPLSSIVIIRTRCAADCEGARLSLGQYAAVFATR